MKLEHIVMFSTTLAHSLVMFLGVWFSKGNMIFTFGWILTVNMFILYKNMDIIETIAKSCNKK